MNPWRRIRHGFLTTPSVACGLRGWRGHNRSAMDAATQDRNERRLTELEIKASYSEDLLDRLNEVVVRQQAEISALQRALQGLRDQALAEPQATFRSLRDELPPHY